MLMGILKISVKGIYDKMHCPREPLIELYMM